MKRMAILLLALMIPFMAASQQYTGMSGLIHIPTADMDPEGVMRVGGHFLNAAFTPDENFSDGDGKYNTGSFYLSVTPFKWLEGGYTVTLRRRVQDYFGQKGDVGYYGKDRYISIKCRVLEEGGWWPSIALGANDPATTAGSGNASFCNFYLALSKHLDFGGHRLGLHAAGRYWPKEFNRKWNGLVGALTYSPPFDHHRMRAIVEYTGADVNVGVDYLLFGHVLLQACLQNGKYFSGGMCLYLNLL